MSRKNVEQLLQAMRPPEKPAPRRLVEQTTKVVESRDDRARLEEVEREEKEKITRLPDFLTVCREQGIKKGSDDYWRLCNLFFRARRQDVGFKLNFWIRRAEEDTESGKILKKILKQGYASEAYNFWRSAQPDQMKYGTASRESRLQTAKDFAEKAGQVLQKIISEREKK